LFGPPAHLSNEFTKPNHELQVQLKENILRRRRGVLHLPFLQNEDSQDIQQPAAGGGSTHQHQVRFYPNSNLLTYMAAFSPKDSFVDFKLESLIELAKLYPNDFNSDELKDLAQDLPIYMDNIY
jgi:hypothetical protein